MNKYVFEKCCTNKHLTDRLIDLPATIHLLNTVALEPFELAYIDDMFTPETDWSMRKYGVNGVLHITIRMIDSGINFSINTNDPEVISQLREAFENNLKLPMTQGLLKTPQYFNDLRNKFKTKICKNHDMIRWDPNVEPLLKTEFEKVGIEYKSDFGKNDYSYPSISKEVKQGNINAVSAFYTWLQDRRTSVFEMPVLDSSIPMCDTHFYKWLTENNIKNHHRLETRLDYLKSLGFDITTQKVDNPEAFKTLNIILDHHYFTEIANKN